MSGKWWDTSWNPISGCTPISAGCDNCYAKATAQTRLRGTGGYPQDDPFRVVVHENRINKPMGWRKARRVFVNSMGDLFHVGIRPSVLTWIFDVMHVCQPAFGRPAHTFIVCTKRAEQMKAWSQQFKYNSEWPREFGHVQLGVTVEDEHNLHRAAKLLDTPAAVRWLSIEPLLGPVDLYQLGWNHPGLDWVVVGCESGHKARPCELQWVIDVVNYCDEFGIPVWVKQLNIGGRVTSNLADFPKHLQRRGLPGGAS